MVKLKNSLEVPVKVVKINIYDVATLQPGETADIKIDSETAIIEMVKTE